MKNNILIKYNKAQYLLAKSLYYTFSATNTLKKDLQYSPAPSTIDGQQERQDMLSKQPQVFRKQGLVLSFIDMLAEGLIKSESQSGEKLERVMSFSEFEEKYVTCDSNNRRIVLQPFIYASELLKNFHPKSMPILWRILLVQAHIYEAIKKTRELPKTETVFRTLKIMSREERRQYDWRNTKEEATDYEVFDKPFEAIKEYFDDHWILRDFVAVNNDTATTA